MSALGQLARRIDAATPPQRDRAVDALRALAIAGVIGGHWLVTALVLGKGHAGTVLSDQSPLASMPWLTPLSWVFQTLAVFFLVGGYSAARSYRGGYLPWLRKRMVRLGRPVAALVAVWIPVTAGLLLAGVSGTTVHTILFLVISPLWFLGVYAGLTALTPAAMWLVRRVGGGLPGRRGGRRRPGPVRPARALLGGLDQPAGRLAGPVPAWHRLGAGVAAWPPPIRDDAPRADAGRRGGRDGRADHLGRLPGQHGRRERIPYLEPEPAHPGRGDVRDRPVRPGAAAAGLAGAGHAPAAGVGRGGHGQPVGDDPVPVARDRARNRQFAGDADRPGAGPADRADERAVGGRAAGLAAGVRDRAGGPVAGVPPGRTLAGAQGQAGRGLDLAQAQVGDQAGPAAQGQAGEDLLQLGDVAGHHGEQVVGLAGHGVGGDDLRRGPDQFVERVAGAHVVTGQGGGHVDLQREAAGVRVELGADDPDDARLLEPADPVQGRRGRQADQAGQLDVGPVGVGLQGVEQLKVNIVK